MVSAGGGSRPLEVLHVYDPNLNPYGFELACLLAESGFDVNWWTSADTTRVPRERVHEYARLAGAGRSSSSLRGVAKRLWQPLSLAVRAGRNPSLICWVRDPWDALVFGIRARLGLPTVVVYHNPRQVRPRGGLSGSMEFWLLRGACVVVHSDWLRSLAAADFPQTVVAPHPPYARTVEAVDLPAKSEPDAGVFCFVGALRHDKGADDLLELARRTQHPWRLRIIGPDRLSRDLERAVRSAGVSVEYIEPQPPSDEALIRAMAASSAMLAPYTAPTASGSVHLAMALGLPVLGLASTSFDDLVPEENQAKDIAGLALLVDQFEDQTTRPMPQRSAPDLAIANAWAEAIRSA